MTRHGARRLGRLYRRSEVRWIAHDKVVARKKPVGNFTVKISLHDRNAVAPWRSGGIFRSLGNSLGHNIQCRYVSFGTPLGNHKRNQPGAGADIKHSATSFHATPRAEQHSIGADLHSRQTVCHGELLEAEYLLSITVSAHFRDKVTIIL